MTKATDYTLGLITAMWGTSVVYFIGREIYDKHRLSQPFSSADLEAIRQKHYVPPKHPKIEFQTDFTEKMYRHARYWNDNDISVKMEKPRDVSVEETEKWIKEMCNDCDTKYSTTMKWFEVRWKKME